MCDCGGSPSQSQNSAASQLTSTDRFKRRGTDPIVRTAGDSMKAADVEHLEQKCIIVGNVAVGAEAEELAAHGQQTLRSACLRRWRLAARLCV